MDKFCTEFSAIIGDATKLRASDFEGLYTQGFMRWVAL